MKKISRFLLIFSSVFVITGCSFFSKEPLKIFSRSIEEPKDARVSDVINWAKDEGYLEKLGINEENASAVLKSMLDNNNLLEEIRTNEKLKKELKQVAIKEASKLRLFIQMKQNVQLS